MSNVLAFPTAQLITEKQGNLFDETQIHAYAIRHPDRVTDMTNKLRLAARAALILHALMNDINTQLSS
ncbi:hypothetical protein [Shinella lacus]|uniref:Uncharacterized protein n=1 Tax=Shinella lacus TaxID=2654216 RepID=A0ABT1RCX8_9HYPH|nr:hypothetical protein [Shinella lacus]MCQ4633035.1 hypothetical protein [Shinella lacus]